MGTSNCGDDTILTRIKKNKKSRKTWEHMMRIPRGRSIKEKVGGRRPAEQQLLKTTAR
jgi:hypothetical protein